MSQDLLQRHLGTSHKIGIEKGYKSGDHGRQRITLLRAEAQNEIDEDKRTNVIVLEAEQY
jgi:hypothetical protein